MALTVLVDGDIVAYRACAACERDLRFDEFNHILTANEEEIWDAATSIMAGISRELHSSQFAIAFSGGDNFRKRLSDTYKRHRGRKPLAYSAVKERFEREFTCKSVETLEGDDLLGIWQTSGKLGDTVIWSGDKDMRGIPGKVYILGKGLSEVSEDEANYFWMTQVLTGDTSDGYPGLPGVGKVGAEKLLGPWVGLPALWEAVVQAYEAKGLGVDDALLQARLARILRASDWDSEKKEVKLWTPN